MTVRVYRGTPPATIQVFDEAPPPALDPTIVNFTATPASITAGQTVTFNATVANAVLVKLNGLAVTLPTTRTPSHSGTYTLTAEGAPGTTPASATTDVTVTQPNTVAPPTWVTEPMSTSVMVAMNAYCLPSGNYDRKQDMEVWKGANVTVGFGGKDGHGLVAGVYTLKVYRFDDDVEVVSFASAPATAGATYWQFTNVPIGALPEGWYTCKITGPAGQSYPTYFAWRHVNGSSTPALMPACTGSYETMSGGFPHRWAKMPASFTPRARPLVPRVHEHFSTALPKAELYREYLMPLREQYIRRPNRGADGELNTFNYMAYHFTSLVAKSPPIMLLDGPRGVGCKSMITHLQAGRNGKTYGSTSWCVFVADATGNLRTLFGFVHDAPANRYDNPAGPRLVGDWSAVPVAIRQLWECWGFAWWQATLAVDVNAPPINGEPPHVGIGPVMFATSPQNGTVFQAQFNGGGDAGLAVFGNRDRDAPPKITVFATGLSDPWDVIEIDGEVFISERGANRVIVHDAATKAFKRVLCSGPMNLAHVNASRIVVLDAPLATVQTGNSVLPEGLAHMDGLVYIGTKAMEQCRKVDKNATNGTTALVCSPPIDGNSRFMKIAVSDGTFGPRGTVFTATWSIANGGMPEAFLPNGTKWDYSGFGHLAQGRGGLWETTGYAAAVGIGDGKLMCGFSSEGIGIVSKAQASDPAPNYASYQAGETAFQPYSVVHGEGGWDFHNFTPPFGVSADMDYFLTNKGITP